MFTNTPLSSQRQEHSSGSKFENEKNEEQGREEVHSDEYPDHESDAEEKCKQSTSKKKVLKVKRANNKSNKVRAYGGNSESV